MRNENGGNASLRQRLSLRPRKPRSIAAGLLLLGLLLPLSGIAQSWLYSQSRAVVKPTTPGSVVARAPSGGGVIVNGSFEDGFTGWTVFDQAASSGSWYAHGTASGPVSGIVVPLPTDGALAALTDQSGPGSHILYQDIAVPTGGGMLMFDLYIGNQAGVFYSPASLDFNVNPNQQFRADIMDLLADPQDVSAGVLATVYQTQPGDVPVTGYSTVSFDLASFAGQTVRLRFAETDNQGFFNAGVDNVSFTAGGFSCGDLTHIVGVWGITSGRCGNFISNTTTARYESAAYQFAPPVLRGSALGEYAYEVEFVANRPKQPSGSASVFVAGSPLPLRTALQNWNQGIAFNISANGKYSIFRYNGTAAPSALQKWTVPAGVAVNTAPASNVLRVERVTSLTSPSGYELVFSLNGVVVKQLSDSYGVDQFGTGFVRSIATTNNLVTDDWMEILDITLTTPPLLRAEQAAGGLVSREQLRANEKANEARGNDDPLFSSPAETGRLGRGR